MNPKYLLIPAATLVLCILIFSFTFKSSSGRKDAIIWSDRSLVWEDFELVDHLDEDYVAMIYSYIACPDLITEKNSKVYAFMNPNLSQRLEGQYDSYNVLVHEQYHFNITEYCARLLRKEMVEKGLGGLSYGTIKSLKEKYAKRLDSLQDVYDNITEHNGNIKMQRYWELKIDDWLRQTAYYKNEDIYSYYNFTENRTRFFKHIYFTSTFKVLTSYPIGEKDMAHGNVYEISYPSHKEKVVKFYKNGKLTNGGYFETAITRIVNKEDGVFEIQYYNPDETYNTELSICIQRSMVDEDKNKIDYYFNESGKRINKNSVFETRWKYNPKGKFYYTTYFDEEARKTANNDGIFHEKRKLDEKERTILVENYERHHKLKNDNYYIAVYEAEFNDDHRKLYYRLYDENGDFAFHLNDYHLTYEYDERGNTAKVISLDKKGEKTYDLNGASIYEYTYDLYDRETSVKRFNANYQPVIASDNYFQQVKDYDSLGRVIFEAYYYPGYVLRFTDDKNGAIKYNRENDSTIVEYNMDAYNNVFENNNNIAIVKYTLNPNKEIASETYLDSNSNFAKMEDGVVEYIYRYDDKGNKIETAAYDSIGNRKEFEADVSIIRWKYDDRGNKLKTTYYNVNDALAHGTDSVTYNIYKYDKNGFLLERFNYDIEMKPSQSDGVFMKKFYKNNLGLDSVVLEYNSRNELKDGVAITKYFYNNYGNQTMEEYYDSKYRRTKNQDGISAIRYRYNKRQLLNGYEYFDEQNRLVNNKNGVAIERSTLDELGHTLTYEYLDKNKRPVLSNYGYHKIEYEWSEMGRTTKTATYGTDLKLIEDEDGTAIYKYKLASSGLIEVIERYNKDGVLADNNDGITTSHYESRLNGLYFLEKELNELGEIVNDSIAE